MDRKNLKKADFAVYNKLGCSGRAVARIRGENEFVIVDSPARGVYKIVAEHVAEPTEITEFMSMIYRRTDGKFGVAFGNGRNVVFESSIQDIKSSGRWLGELFIIRERNQEYIIKLDGQGEIKYLTEPYASIRRYNHFGNAVVTENGNGLCTFVMDWDFKRISGKFSSIGDQNDDGCFVTTAGLGSYIYNSRMRNANKDISKVFFEVDESGVIKAPTTMMPVKFKNGMVGLVDATKADAPSISNTIYADSITAPSKYGVVTIHSSLGNTGSDEHVVLFEGDEEGMYEINMKKNKIQDVGLYSGVLESLVKTQGESIFRLDRKYFMDPNTLGDIKVAYKKYFEQRVMSAEKLLLSDRKYEDLTQDQAEYLEFLLAGIKEELQKNFTLCMVAKNTSGDAKSVEGHALDDLTIDEILYNPMQEIYDELNSENQ